MWDSLRDLTLVVVKTYLLPALLVTLVNTFMFRMWRDFLCHWCAWPFGSRAWCKDLGHHPKRLVF